MELDASITDSELPKLKDLAAELVAARAPRLVLLDDIASLAAAIAARSRDAARQQLLDKIGQGVQAVFPTATEDLRSRLASSSLDELSSLGELVTRAVGARTAFDEADSGLMAARDRGDYAAMAPLAIEAGAQKSALAAASAELANRIGAGAAATSEQPAATASDAAADRTPEGLPNEMPAAPPAAGELQAAGESEAAAAVLTMAEEAVGAPAAVELRQDEARRPPTTDTPQGQAEHRRIRGLIRQMRGTMDESP